jgi:MFS family permease
MLKFSGQEIGAAYGAFAIGSMISPFFVGLIADRYFASEKMLAVLGILGGVVLCALAHVVVFKTFYRTLILYCALYAPTLALGNSRSLHHLLDSKNDFPRVKIFSAVGWIAGGVTLSFLNGEQSPSQFYLAGAVSILLGAFSLSLPHTPPKKVGQNVSLGDVLGLDALALMKKRAFAIFIVCMFLICIPLYFYFVMMSIYLTELQWSGLAGKMTLAQISDVIFLFLLPIMLRNLGYKKTIFIGILAWVARYFLLARSVNALALRMEEHQHTAAALEDQLRNERAARLVETLPPASITAPAYVRPAASRIPPAPVEPAFAEATADPAVDLPAEEEAYWGLRETAFENAPNPRFLWLSPAHSDALVRLSYALRQRRGCAVLTGEPGCGKTLLTRAVVQRLEPNRYEVGLLTNPHGGRVDLLREVLYELGVETAESDRAERSLVARGAKVERVDRPMMAHAIDDESLAAAVAFLARNLGAR